MSTPFTTRPELLGAWTLGKLRRRGHDVQVTGDWELGRLSAVGR